jgi:hypothetical protein
MLKTLKKQSKKKILNKAKIKFFLKHQLWQHLLVVAFVSLCAWIFDKAFEAVMFCVAHIVVRKHFDKQYHCGTTALCTITTLTIAFFGIASILPVAISLLSTVPICCFISWVGYIAQDRIDLLKKKKEEEIFMMTEEKLRELGRIKGLSEIQQDILVHRLIDKLKISQICEYRGYGRSTIKYHIGEIKRKLNLKSL